MSALKFPNSKHLKNDLSAGKISHKYLFLGEEDGEKDKFISAIIEMAISDPEERRVSVSRFHADNNELMAAASYALSSSMFSSQRLCVIYNIEGISQNAPMKDLFNELIDELPADMILIMTSSENRPPKFIDQKKIDSLKVVQFWRYFDSDLRNYITTSLSKHAIRLDEGAMNHLIDMSGKDIKRIDDAIDALVYSGLNGNLSIKDTRPFLEDVKEVSIFELVESVFTAGKKSLYLLKKIIDDGAPELYVINMIIRQAEIIEKYHDSINKGLISEDALKKCGITERGKDQFIRQISIFSPRMIKRVFPMITICDHAVKSYRPSREFIASPAVDLVYSIISLPSVKAVR